MDLASINFELARMLVLPLAAVTLVVVACVQILEWYELLHWGRDFIGLGLMAGDALGSTKPYVPAYHHDDERIAA